jgi:hypothetical protein
VLEIFPYIGVIYGRYLLPIGSCCMAIELRQEFSNDSNMFSIHQILAIQEVPGNLQIGRFFSFCHARKTIFPVNFKNVKSLQLWLISMNYHKPSQDTRKVPLQTNCWLVVLTHLEKY